MTDLEDMALDVGRGEAVSVHHQLAVEIYLRATCLEPKHHGMWLVIVDGGAARHVPDPADIIDQLPVADEQRLRLGNPLSVW